MEIDPTLTGYQQAVRAVPIDTRRDIFELNDSLSAWLADRLKHFVDVDVHVTDRDFTGETPAGTWHEAARRHAQALHTYSLRESAEEHGEDLKLYADHLHPDLEPAREALRWVADNLDRLWI